MIDINKYQKKLAEDKTRVELALDEIGKRDPKNKENWDVKPVDVSEVTFHDEVADRFEEMDERKATEFSLESELASINDALEAIDQGTYGHCKICGKEIETERLDASPAATTCKEHLES
ncbi:MAG: TraR/DksA C4-type zinc finger protein [Candidatus Paceibacterota bacterium]|jgi:RNA polymerase-binding transcription factor DksA